MLEDRSALQMGPGRLEKRADGKLMKFITDMKEDPQIVGNKTM